MPSPSPSPPPAPPIPATPGRRASAFQTIFTDALTHTIKTCNYQNFASCFPTPAQHCPGFLYKLWSQLLGAFEARAKAEFETILLERNVVPNLNALDSLIAEARKRKARAPSSQPPPAPPHTLPPPALLLAHLHPHLSHTQSQLNASLQTIQSQNALLSTTIQAQREEIANLLKGLEEVVGDLGGAVEGLRGEGEGVEGLGREAERLDGEVRAVPG
ncbi:hypothetical protein FGG08_005790 [Glutinoglossum americanum]|uniref:MIND kinetochore complex component Nnf1 n=1 Tax=Glutinoglossum americanum TaxID=1670608 RepID=A0A9P8I2K0_9PEZI|nr:hypothetical protein FGG08_005790 [Glutinoglossum americanum]